MKSLRLVMVIVLAFAACLGIRRLAGVGAAGDWIYVAPSDTCEEKECPRAAAPSLLASARSLLQEIKVPEFWHEPASLDVAGPEIMVTVHHTPFRLEVSGPAALEQLDDHRIRLKSQSGHVSIRLAPDEAIYGLTARIVADRTRSETSVEPVGGLDRRGEEVSMWVLPSEAVYAPFYVSSAGYGLLVEGTWPGIFDIGKSDKEKLQLRWETDTGGLSAVFIDGPTYTEVLDRYTATTGRPILPPKWSFLPWKWRDEHRAGIFAELDGLRVNADVAEDISQYDKLDLPVGVYLLDRPWSEGTYGYGNLTWDKNRFPNGDAMVKKLQERGWHVLVWGGPWALGYDDREFGPEARAKGFVKGDRNIDYTNPDAVAWQKEKLEAFMRRSGINGWKLDRGDEFTPSSRADRYADGRSGREVHNDYPRMYVKTFYDVSRSVLGDDFLIKARPAYTGTTAWSIVYGGDFQGNGNGLRSAIIGMQRTAFMGYPVWGSDTGGYFGFTDRRVFARWLEFSAFCPLMEIGGDGPHEPWAMPGTPEYDEEMIAIYRRYTWLHTRLVDYTYALARRAHETGDPIVHPLVFDFPNDPNVKNLWDEYLYGPSLLVAPMWEPGKTEREVYLPEGEWWDLWDTSKKYQGPITITADAPLDHIPVYVRAKEAERLPRGLVDGL